MLKMDNDKKVKCKNQAEVVMKNLSEQKIIYFSTPDTFHTSLAYVVQ